VKANCLKSPVKMFGILQCM